MIFCILIKVLQIAWNLYPLFKMRMWVPEISNIFYPDHVFRAMAGTTNYFVRIFMDTWKMAFNTFVYLIYR